MTVEHDNSIEGDNPIASLSHDQKFNSLRLVLKRSEVISTQCDRSNPHHEFDIPKDVINRYFRPMTDLDRIAFPLQHEPKFS